MVRFFLVFLLFTNLACARFISNKQYDDALEEGRSGNLHFAFMKFKNYLAENPDSIYAKNIKFALAEYYFQVKDYREAINSLVDYITAFRKDESSIFAQAMLYNILLEYKKEPQLTEKIKADFFAAPLFLVFSEFKSKYYKSILNNTYEIIDYIDRVEFFKNNELFLKITP